MRVVVADAVVLHGDALASALAAVDHGPVLEVVRRASDPDDVRAVVASTPVDVVLLDPRIAADVDGLVSSLVATGVRVVLLPVDDDAPLLNRLLREGAYGYIPRSVPAPVLRRAIALIAEGVALSTPALLSTASLALATAYSPLARGLDEGQLDLLRRLARDEPIEEIAADTHVSTRTVRRRVRDLLDDLGLQSRVQAAEFAGRLHLLEGLEPGLDPV